jgi:Tfp pilus assembly protein PilF
MQENNFFKTNAELFVFVGLTLACLAIYGQTAGFGFINLDDNLYVYENAHVLSGLNADSIKWAFTEFHAANWHPLTWISHMADVSLFGVNAGAHHATNIVFHILNSLLTFAVFRRLTGDFWKSAVVAALFAVHPAHVESVAWVSERKDMLSTMFWLITMFAYVKYAETKEEKERKPGNAAIFYVLTLVFFAFGLMSKPMLVTLPFVLLLCDYWALERLKTLKDIPRLVLEKTPFFVLSAASSFITIIAQKSEGAVQTLDQLPLEMRLTNAITAYAQYVVMLFYPANLAVWYPYKKDVPMWQTAGAVILILLITAFCLQQMKRRKYLLMGWLWFLGTLVPVIGIVQVGAQSMADRYTYVPYIGLFVMLAWGADEIFERFGWQKALVPIFAAAILVFGFLSFKQASLWRNNETLYRHTLAVTERNFLISHNLCNNLLLQERLEEAAELCRAAIEYNPVYTSAHNTFGVINVKLQRYEEAIENFKKAMSLTPNNPLIYTNIAVPLAHLGRTDEAYEYLQKASRFRNSKDVNPEVVATAYNNLAEAFMKQKQPGKAARALEKVLEILPSRADIRGNYAFALFIDNRLEEAQKQIEETLRQVPNQPEPYNTYGLILLALNKRDEAVKQFEKALELNPDYAAAKENLQKAKGGK